ncbi:MAG: hypothetical protein WKG06_13755 [Segetibacter sp.]
MKTIASVCSWTISSKLLGFFLIVLIAGLPEKIHAQNADETAIRKITRRPDHSLEQRQY